MKTTIGQLKRMISEASGPRRFSLGGSRGGPVRFDPARDTIGDVMHAAMQEFGGVGADLGVEDVREGAWLDYVGDKLSDAGVPDDMIDQVQAKFAAGKTK